MEKKYTAEKKGYFFLMDDIRMKSISLPQLLNECEKEPAEGYPLRFGGLPNIHTTSMIMSEILSAVYKIHTIKQPDCVGFLHGDIQENNIFFQDTDIVQGNIGVACLLDLGSMKKIEKDGLTKEMDCLELSSTQGYIPPELLFAESRIRMGVQADIYSLGRMFFYMLTGKKYLEKEGNRVDYEETIFRISPSQGDRIGCRRSVQCYVNDILSKALAFHLEVR